MDDFHFHVCPKRGCGRIWAHDKNLIPTGGSRAAHTCPKCGIGRDYWACNTRYEAEMVRIRERKIRCRWGDTGLAAAHLGRDIWHHLQIGFLEAVIAILKLFERKSP